MCNVRTWSDHSKKLPSTSCLLGIRKSNEHCSKVVSGCWRKNMRKISVTDTRVHDNMVPWALRALGTKTIVKKEKNFHREILSSEKKWPL